MRAQRRALLTGGDMVKLEADAGPVSSRLVIECEHVSKGFAGRPVISDFSTRILRGDRIGLIGPNGAGTTTLLKLLVGALEPGSGRIRRAKTRSEEHTSALQSLL